MKTRYYLTHGQLTQINQMTVPKNISEPEVINFVTTRLAETAALTGHPVLLFTYR
jgi:hypothetical protein